MIEPVGIAIDKAAHDERVWSAAWDPVTHDHLGRPFPSASFFPLESSIVEPSYEWTRENN
jgi:hypothetical protein